MDDRFDTFTSGAKRVLVGAQRAAQRLNHPSIGTEHLLLGLAAEGERGAAGVLAGLRIELEAVRAAVRRSRDASTAYRRGWGIGGATNPGPENGNAPG